MNGDEREVGDKEHAIEPLIGPPAQSTQSPRDVLSDEEQQAIDDFLSALNRESEMRRVEFKRFGICSPGTPGLQVSRLVQSCQQKRNAFKGVHATKGKYIFLESINLISS